MLSKSRVKPLTKTCRDCKVEKASSEFFAQDKEHKYLSSYCKPCKKIRISQFYKLNPEKDRSYYLTQAFKTRYRRIDRAIYNKMYEEQQGLCKICNKTCDKYKVLCIDHDHATGYLRGLLCNHCNLALGHFKDNPDVIKAALDYLITYQKQKDSPNGVNVLAT